MAVLLVGFMTITSMAVWFLYCNDLTLKQRRGLLDGKASR